MNKITVNENEEKIFYTGSDDITYDVLENGKLIVFEYVVNDSNKVIINLKGKNAEVEYHYSVINYDNNKFNITINHFANNTVSNIFNHGVNVLNNALTFEVSGVVPKNSNGCTCNQKNQIINLANGAGEIKPNLLIDNFDVVSSHAAYIGKFKDELLFYLMSRGISKSNAVELLMTSLLLNEGDVKEPIVEAFLKQIKEV